jgi:hypothetical protein
MAAIVIGSVGFDFGPRKLVVFRVDRRDLPHLTCSWGNPSHEVDLHLTPAFSTADADREPILRMGESELKARLGDLVRQAWLVLQGHTVSVVWGIHARWLANHSYSLVGAKDTPIVDWLQSALPKIRGKFRLDHDRIKKLPRMALFHSTPRRFQLSGQYGQIYALCTRGPDRGRVLVLQGLALGSPLSTWVALDFADMARLCRAIDRLLRQWLRSLVPGAWETICTALELKKGCLLTSAPPTR